ncbi:uncharacterized protein LOC134271899 [Saccostrea cucullata]|uniref:uncharacterized protein LOC134271899 n=1 Tax=Saccostrea cuccullata TaxID=36930 RepID=UPI002ED1CE4C
MWKERNEKKTVPLEAYKTVESGFRSLKDIASRRKFCDELNAVLAKLKIAFADDVSHLDSSGELFTPADCILQTDSELDSTVEESPASSASSQDASTSRKYVHKELEEEVKIMRDAHPQSGKVGRREFLKTGDVAWRRKCEVLLAFRPKVHAGTFGGSFREQIYLSTLPECCFEELQGIFAAFKRGDIPTMRNTKSIKPGLFALLVGEKREVEVHHHLSNLANGLVSLDQFRKDISSLKKTRSNEESMQEIKRENRRLRDENAKLKDQLEEMRQKFGSGQNEMDPFTFDEAGEEVQEEEENPMSTLETQQTRGPKKDNRRKETAVQRKESELQNAWVVLERIQEEDISTQSVVTIKSRQKGHIHQRRCSGGILLPRENLVSRQCVGEKEESRRLQGEVHHGQLRGGGETCPCEEDCSII